MKEALFEMKIGDQIKFERWDVWRVPGGWIFALDAQSYGLSQFVPFNHTVRNFDLDL